ncbi:MAG: non-ribosomal peptide synthetase, partial [Mycobacterium sp.]|nr:non-ribosomal peptide synthetase [Mycobacterium sp.]
REDAVVSHSCDTSATVGWFTSVYPVRLGAAEAPVDIGAAKDAAVARTLVRSITDQLARVPNRGLDYGVLRYLRGDFADQPEPQVEFNYIGRHDLSGERSGAEWSLLTDAALNTQLPVSAEPDLPLRYTFDVICVVAAGPDGPQLRTSWRWSDRLSSEAEVDRLSELWSQAVTVLGEAL